MKAFLMGCLVLVTSLGFFSLAGRTVGSTPTPEEVLRKAEDDCESSS
jgi:hypothetical protein